MPSLKKIVLLMPRGKVYKYKTGAFGKYIRYAPLTLPTLAALIPKDLKVEVELFDEGVEEIKKEDITADLIGISAITGTVKRAYRYAKYFRSMGIPVVIGGVHATLMPEEVMKHADAVVSGLGVKTWPQLLRDFKKGKMKKLYKQDINKVDFSNWPIPKRDLFDTKKTKFITTNSIQATYGCTNKCAFCVTPFSCPGYHHRPIEDVVADLKSIKSKYVVFVDPSPIEDRNYAIALYKAITPLKKIWVSPSTIRIAHDEELLKIASKSGCRGLLIGYESVTANTLKNINKSFNSIDLYYEGAKKLHKKGIAIMGCFVFGLDDDNKEVFKRTIDFVNKANIDLPRFTVNTPFPATSHYQQLEKEKRIIEKDWSLYDCQHVVIKPKLMTAKELQDGHHWAWKEAYKLSSIIKRILCSRSFIGVSLLSSLAYKNYGHNLPKFTKKVMIDHSDVY